MALLRQHDITGYHEVGVDTLAASESSIPRDTLPAPRDFWDEPAVFTRSPQRSGIFELFPALEDDRLGATG